MQVDSATHGPRLTMRMLPCLAALGLAASLHAQAPSSPSTPAPRLLDAAAARAVGFLPGWQTRLPILEGGVLKGVHYQSPEPNESTGSLFAWDDEGVIMKIEPTTGDLRWHSASVSSKGGSGLVDVNAAGTGTTSLVIGLGDISCLTLDARTGIEMGQTRYPHIPVTRSIRSGTDLVFGSRGGHLVWLGFRDERVPSRIEARAGEPTRKETAVSAVHALAFEERAHQLHGSIHADPIAAGDSIVACSNTGEVACFGQTTRNRRWDVKLPGGVVASPATDGRNIYVACRDQYLRCIELTKGQTKWKWFCESPLENPPLLAGNLVMLQVPDLGLVALEAGTEGRTREPKWKSNAKGNPITRIPEGIVVWDAASSTLSLVDDTTGIVRESRTIQGIRQVRASAAMGGDLYLMAEDGRLQRCPPVSPMPAAPAAAPTASEPAEAPATESAATSQTESGDATPAGEPNADPSGN